MPWLAIARTGQGNLRDQVEKYLISGGLRDRVGL
jgi:hypothetical protein